jgi:hypothetical protein
VVRGGAKWVGKNAIRQRENLEPSIGSGAVTSEVPDYPGQLLPSPIALWQAFEVALAELERNRGREPRRSGHAAQVQKAFYEAGLRAAMGRRGGVRRLIATHVTPGFGTDVASRVWAATMVMQITPMISITAT